MTVFVCVDDENGMLFNRRRQSRDRVLIEDVLRTAGGAPLWVSPYSAPLFAEADPAVHTAEQPLEAAGAEEACFVEVPPLAPWLARIQTLIVYRWNRLYPSDRRLDIDPAQGFSLRETSEFAGSSHEKITKEVWSR